jgi:hypothetical protein
MLPQPDCAYSYEIEVRDNLGGLQGALRIDPAPELPEIGSERLAKLADCGFAGHAVGVLAL